MNAASILATFLVSALSIVVSFAAHKTASDNATAIETDRVEIDRTLTNSNAASDGSFDYTNPWGPWEEPVTPTTTFIGVQRRVIFKQPFSTIPSVSTALSLIDVQPTEQMLKDLGYHAAADEPGLHDIHVKAVAETISEKGFTLKLGIGMRASPAKFLSTKLESTPVETAFIAAMMRYHQLADRPNLTLSRDETWMVNFYREVGALEASWIAQGRGR